MSRRGSRWYDGLLKPCGTTAAYRRHQRHGEPVDESCRQAKAREQADHRQQPPSPQLAAKARAHAAALLAFTGKADAARLARQLGVSESTIYHWRRALLDANTAGGAVVHWQKPGAPPSTAVCHGRHTRAQVTTRAELVTCGTCQQSRAWRHAHAAVTR